MSRREEEVSSALQRRRGLPRGSISVFLALLLASCILLCAACVESVRAFALRTRLIQSGDSAMDSLFAAYDGDVADRYGLLMINPRDLPKGRLLEEDAAYYLQREMNAATARLPIGGSMLRANTAVVYVKDMSFMTDRGGAYFVRDALEYMKYRLLGITVEELKAQIDKVREGESEKERNAGEEAKGNVGGADDVKEGENGTGQEMKGWFTALKELKKGGFLSLILPIDRVASAHEIKTSGFPSRQYLTLARLLWPFDSYPLQEQLLFTEYLLEQFTDFCGKKPKAGMQYELEYILCGKDTDKGNLEGAVTQMLLLREGMNLLSLAKDAALRRQVQAAAFAIAGWSGVPGAVLAAQALVAAGWAFGESVIDLRTLVSGGKIPLVKDDKSWALSIGQIPGLLGGDKTLVAHNEQGMGYHAYLRLLLYVTDMQVRAYRAMDVIQEKMQLVKADFYIDDCLYGVQLRMGITATPLFSVPGVRRYELAESFSRTY